MRTPSKPATASTATATRACCCRELLRCAEAWARADRRRRPLAGCVGFRPKLQPVTEVAADQLLELPDFVLELSANVLLHAERQRLPPRGNAVPLQKALAEGEDRIERAAVGEVAVEFPLTVSIVRPCHIFAHRS